MQELLKNVPIVPQNMCAKNKKKSIIIRYPIVWTYGHIYIFQSKVIHKAYEELAISGFTWVRLDSFLFSYLRSLILNILLRVLIVTFCYCEWTKHQIEIFC